MKKYSALLADADGTLLDFAKAEAYAFRMTCDEMGIPAGDEIAALYRQINDSLWRAFERNEVTQEELRVTRFSLFLSEARVKADAKAMAERYTNALSQQAHEIDGAHDFLRQAAGRVPVVIVTNGIAFIQRERFRRSSLSQYVTDYVISGEVGCAKPDPRMILLALEKSGVSSPQAALMLGDEPRSDIAAAIAASVDSCWFNPQRRENTSPHHPTHQITRLMETLAWL